MKVYAFQSIGLPQVIAEDDRPRAENNGFKASLTIPAASTFDIAKVLLVYALHNVDREAVEELAREILDIKAPAAEEPHVAAWQLPMFTDQDREAIVASMMDEVADESVKDRAHDALEHLSLAETIAYVFPDDLEPLVEMLQRIDNKSDEEHITGEFLREHNDGDDYDTMLDFAVRMSLLNDDETELTDLGREFVGNNS